MDPRFSLEQGTGIYTGNELIVKGALESQVGVITGYPGSPLAELFETIENNKDLFNEHGIVAQIANNEALAAARLNGSQMEGIRALAVMKSVGLHVAADGLALGNMVGAAPNGGGPSRRGRRHLVGGNPSTGGLALFVPASLHAGPRTCDLSGDQRLDWAGL